MSGSRLPWVWVGFAAAASACLAFLPGRCGALPGLALGALAIALAQVAFANVREAPFQNFAKAFGAVFATQMLVFAGLAALVVAGAEAGLSILVAYSATCFVGMLGLGLGLNHAR